MGTNKIMLEGVRIPGVNYGSAILIHLNEDLLLEDCNIQEIIKNNENAHPMVGPFGSFKRNGNQYKYAKIFTVWGDEIHYSQLMFNIYPQHKYDRCKFGSPLEICIMGIESKPLYQDFDHSIITFSDNVNKCWFEGQDTLFPKRVPYHLWWTPNTNVFDPNSYDDDRVKNVHGKRLWFF